MGPRAGSDRGYDPRTRLEGLTDCGFQLKLIMISLVSSRGVDGCA